MPFTYDSVSQKKECKIFSYLYKRYKTMADDARERAKQMRKLVSSFAKTNGITLKPIPNVALRVLRKDLAVCRSKKLQGRNPTKLQINRHNNVLMQNLLQRLMDNNAQSVICRNRLSKDLIEHIVCGQVNYSINPSVIVALGSARQNGESVLIVLGFIIWGTFNDHVLEGNDTKNKHHIRLRRLTDRGGAGVIYGENNTFAELSLICSRANTHKPLGKTLLAYCIWDIYKRRRAGEIRFNGIHLTVVGDDDDDYDYRQYAAHIRKDEKAYAPYRLYYGFGFRETMAVRANNQKQRVIGEEMKHGDFHMMLFWGPNGLTGNLVTTLEAQISSSQEVRQICPRNPKCFP